MTTTGDDQYLPERARNPLVNSAQGGRVLSAMQRPWFAIAPPRGYGVLTTTGRRSGRPRPKCVRAIRAGDRAYLVSLGGERAAWVKNVRADPRVTLRIRGGEFSGSVRDVPDRDAAFATFCGTVVPTDYTACMLHRRGLPSRRKVEELVRTWFEQGLPLVVELETG